MVATLSSLYTGEASRGGSTAAFSAAYVADERSYGDFGLGCAARRASNLLAHRKAGAPFQYHFVHAPLKLQPSGFFFGAFHSSEIPFVFGLKEDLQGDEELRLSRNFSSAYGMFAATGEPGGGWLPFSSDPNGGSRVFNLSAISGAFGWDKAVCDGFWSPFTEKRMANLPPAPPMEAAPDSAERKPIFFAGAHRPGPERRAEPGLRKMVGCDPAL